MRFFLLASVLLAACEPAATASDLRAVTDPVLDKPCLLDEDCGISRCVAREDQGSFCSVACDEEAPCPEAHSCTDGRCIADEAPTTCHASWTTATTTCRITNDFGTCNGRRACDGETLSACNARTPAAESCNGVDDDCDGAIDEELDCLSCPADRCKIGGGCIAAGVISPANPCFVCNPTMAANDWTPRTGLACSDGDPCTTGDVCTTSGCVGVFMDCSGSGNEPCTSGVCSQDGGCVTRMNNGFPCDDGNYCTVDDKCAMGACAPGPARDCTAMDALPCGSGVCDETNDTCVTEANVGDACDDEDLCSTASACAADQTCSVKTPMDCSGGVNDCNTSTCNGANGTCEQHATNLGGACDDLDACTSDGTCADSGGVGVCNPGPIAVDAFEANETASAGYDSADIDDCGDNERTIEATINPNTDVDWYDFQLNNSSGLCDYGTKFKLDPPTGADYDLLVCVKMSKSFTRTCNSPATTATPPADLSGYLCCESAATGDVTEEMKIDWTCTAFACSDATGEISVRVQPKATVPPICTTYRLTYVDD